MPTINPAEDDLRWLIRNIAAAPGRLDWLRRLVARNLETVADMLRERDMPAAAVEVHQQAERVRKGEVLLW